MENNDYIKFMKQQQEMILKQQQQISSLLEMQQTQKIQQENKEYVQDLNPTYEEEIQYSEHEDKPKLKIDPFKIVSGIEYKSNKTITFVFELVTTYITIYLYVSGHI